MSTTFGVKFGDGVIEVARRCNGFIWIEDMAKHLPKYTPVIPLDNSAQGIETIGDIVKEVGMDTSLDIEYYIKEKERIDARITLYPNGYKREMLKFTLKEIEDIIVIFKENERNKKIKKILSS